MNREKRYAKMWRLDKNNVGKLKKKNKAILLQGLPGIGNVGRISVEYMIDELKAKKVGYYEDVRRPALVFLNDKGIELPKIELYYVPKYNIYLVTGNYQPLGEEDSWKYAYHTLNLRNKLGIKEFIAIGGIGTRTENTNPNVFCIPSQEKFKDTFKEYGVKVVSDPLLHQMVNSIMGAAGTLLGVAKEKNIKAFTLLGETTNELIPGIRASKKIVEVLSKAYNLDISTKEIKKEIRRSGNFLKKIIKKEEKSRQSDVSYIG